MLRISNQRETYCFNYTSSIVIRGFVVRNYFRLNGDYAFNLVIKWEEG